MKVPDRRTSFFTFSTKMFICPTVFTFFHPSCQKWKKNIHALLHFFFSFLFLKADKKCKFRESKVMLIFLTLPANKELQNTTTTVLPSASILPFYRNNNAASSVPPVQKLYSVALVKPQISCLSLGWANRCCHFQH